MLVSVEQYDSCWMPGFGSVEEEKKWTKNEWALAGQGKTGNIK